ncbi:hypothetical protein [Streptomyces spinoverrucosus]|uniref:hypothetical protein n=1 Tax=Streptomyces spinoverrucosus TaxID=284043 RepID=UPI001C3F9CA4|nr:hypothetical protein [Streptomyces spinoverrucosus]
MAGPRSRKFRVAITPEYAAGEITLSQRFFDDVNDTSNVTLTFYIPATRETRPTRRGLGSPPPSHDVTREKAPCRPPMASVPSPRGVAGPDACIPESAQHQCRNPARLR